MGAPHPIFLLNGIEFLEVTDSSLDEESAPPQPAFPPPPPPAPSYSLFIRRESLLGIVEVFSPTMRHALALSPLLSGNILCLLLMVRSHLLHISPVSSPSGSYFSCYFSVVCARKFFCGYCSCLGPQGLPFLPWRFLPPFPILSLPSC